MRTDGAWYIVDLSNGMVHRLWAQSEDDARQRALRRNVFDGKPPAWVKSVSAPRSS